MGARKSSGVRLVASAEVSPSVPGRRIPSSEAVAIDLLFSIREGDMPKLRRLLYDEPDLVTARFVGRGDGTRTALHIVTDWPGYFPNGPEVADLLITGGADPDARTTGKSPEPGPGDETPLHWAASSDDADVAAVLIEAGADVEAPDGSIGTPLDNAVGYCCWHVARLLVARGARVERAWQAAALGLLPQLVTLLGDKPEPEVVNQAFWHACAGGQRCAAEALVARGADLNWEPDYARGTPLDQVTHLSTRRENVATWLKELGARSDSAGE